jgi:hypothetical protein
MSIQKKRSDGYPCHQCAPKDWRNVPVITGDYDFDATILHRKNLDMIGRLELYVRPKRASYGYKTSYDAYESSGDD